MEQYAALEDEADYKSEFISGCIYRVDQVSPRHCALAANICGEIGRWLKRTPHQVYSSSLRVTVMAASFSTYPDVTIVCGEPHINPFDKNSIINPAVIFEVLSPSTERYDRGEKWEHYQRLDSLQEYLLVSQHKPKVEQYVRQSNGTWIFTSVEGLDAAVTVQGVSLLLAEVYDKIAFPEADGIHEAAADRM